MRNIKLLLLMLLFATFASAQKIDSTLSIYNTRYQPEKLHIHFDKSLYSPGETIWFKAYLMEGFYPAEGSKTLYIDFADEKGNTLMHQVYPVVQSGAYGQFEIPSGFAASSINVRAYTTWMLNFDSAFLYKKQLPVVYQNPKLGTANIKLSFKPSITFFPEGGDLIGGLSTRIAFKAHDQFGKPVVVTGNVLNAKGEKIQTFTSTHDGMGYFNLTPAVQEKYAIKWKTIDKVERTAVLPAIKQDGVGLSIIQAGTKRQFIISRKENMQADLSELHVYGTMQQNVMFKAAVKNQVLQTRGTIETAQFPSGILTITVFDRNWKPIAERITYINNNEYRFEPEVGFKQLDFRKRARNEIQVVVPDSLAGNLSLSVTDAGITTAPSATIISQLMLSGDLRGDVYNPSYYFSSAADSVQQHLDLVMMTHGWRKFKWEEALAGKFPKIRYPKDSSYLSLSGKVIGLTNSQIQEAQKVNLFITVDSTRRLLSIPLKKDGSFVDESTIFYDTLKVYYQLGSKNLAGMGEVSFMPSRIATPSNIAIAGIDPATYSDTAGAYANYLRMQEKIKLDELLKGVTLEGVTVTAKAKSPEKTMNDRYTSGLFRTEDAYQFDVANDIVAQSSLNIFNYLQGRVPGLQVNSSMGQAQLNWRGGSPALYLDEIQTDPSMIASIPVADIAFVKVIRPPFSGSMNGANGAIAIYTRKGDDVKHRPGKGLSKNVALGYTAPRQFYSPNYGSFQKSHEAKDLRTTLYWNPAIITEPGKATIRLPFYNNDVTTGFRIVLEGMSRDGQLTRVEKVIE